VSACPLNASIRPFIRSRKAGGEYANRDYFTFSAEDQWRVWQAARRSALLEAAMVCEECHPNDLAFLGGALRALADEATKG
jgi:hypothetical protein